MLELAKLIIKKNCYTQNQHLSPKTVYNKLIYPKLAQVRKKIY
jgi:hypothetical protein